MLNYAIALDRIRSSLAMNREDFLAFVQVSTGLLSEVKRERRKMPEEMIKSISTKLRISEKEFEHLAATRVPKLLPKIEGGESPLYSLIRLQSEVREKLGLSLEV